MYTVTIKKRKQGAKRYRTVSRKRNYKNAWNQVVDDLLKNDANLHFSYSLQFLCKGYTKQRIFPFGSTEISHGGIQYKIVI